MNDALEAAIAAADAAARASAVQLRELSSQADLDAVDRLFDDIWRPTPGNSPLNGELLRAFSKAGNYLGGAFDGDVLVGASVGFFGAPARAVLHSHIAGVSGAARGRDVGFALKLHQRAWSLEHGATAIEWTFDPLVRRNAYFNIGKLAAIPVEYLHNFYGDMHDAINAGDSSDRLLVRWQLDSPAVIAACAGSSVDVDVHAVHGARALTVDADGRPERGRADGDTVLVAVPPDIESLRTADPAAAGQWRSAVRETLGRLLADGARITGFDRAGWYVVQRRLS